ncbi:DUF3558 domain-containing protein [Nocardia asiatica]|uniref:DUF3558 domain-containing protein n=1 Tax=Nocardia asiatica TaxID=209252 RepID=UPI002456F59E|nr:DUF3558 domain-containing protein [Nocardia asiatica]
MNKLTQSMIIGALICAALVGCTRDEPEPVDTTSTAYMFDNIFNPCRQIPRQFLENHRFGENPKSGQSNIEDHASLGCTYDGPEYIFSVHVSNAPLSEIGRLNRHTFRETRIAGRAAKIKSSPPGQHPSCVLNIEMTGGVLSLYLVIKVVLDPCTTLTALAEELIPLLPPKA